jgi:hypothetical protein
MPDPDREDVQVKYPSWLDSTLKLVNLLAIIISGCWVLFLFLSFQSESNRVLLKQQEIAKEQSVLNLQIAKATQEATIAQAKITAAQAEFTLKTQQAQKDLREKELKYAVEEHRLEAKSKQLAIVSRTTYRTAKLSKWEAHEVRDGVLQVIYHPGITNASEEPFEVSLIEVNVYAGYVNPEFRGLGEKNLSHVVTGPPAYGAERAVQGAVTWRRIAARTSVYSPAAATLRATKVFIAEPSEIDSFGTGIWKSGEQVDFEPEVLIDPRDMDFIGVSVRMIFNRGQRDEDKWRFADWRPLKTLLSQRP